MHSVGESQKLFPQQKRTKARIEPIKQDLPPDAILVQFDWFDPLNTQNKVREVGLKGLARRKSQAMTQRHKAHAGLKAGHQVSVVGHGARKARVAYVEDNVHPSRSGSMWHVAWRKHPVDRVCGELSVQDYQPVKSSTNFGFSVSATHDLQPDQPLVHE